MLDIDHSEPITGFASQEIGVRLKSLGEITRALNAGSHTDGLLHVVMAICRYSSWDKAALIAVNREDGYSHLLVRYDPYLIDSVPQDSSWALETSPNRIVAETNETLVIEDILTADNYPFYRQEALAHPFRTLALVPLPARDMFGRAIILSVKSRDKVSVSAEEKLFLELAAQHAAIAVHNAIQRQTELDFANKLRFVLDKHSQMMTDVLENAPMEKILSTVEGLVERPFVVVAANSTLLHVGGSPDPERISHAKWGEFLAKASGHLFKNLIRDTRRRGHGGPQTVDLTSLGLDIKLSAMVEPLVIEGDILGGVIIFEAGRPFGDLDSLVASEVRYGLSIQFMRGFIRFQNETALRKDLLTDLFRGGFKSVGELLARGDHLGIGLAKPNVLFVVSPARAHQDFAPDTNHYTLQHSLQRGVDMLRPGGKVVFDEGEFVIFLPVTIEEESAQIQRLAHFVGREWERELGEAPIMTVSERCTDLAGYRNARQECKRAIMLGRILDKRGLVSVDDFGVYSLLFATANDDYIQKFLQKTVGPVADHDRAHKTEFLSTIEAFLQANSRLQTAADALGIHVSTLRYRLGRIQDVLGIDLDDANARFSLDLGIRMIKLLKPLDK
ncbi:MAG: helix-turn-helix domain-containing protein [Pseudorhodoplanes sp.]